MANLAKWAPTSYNGVITPTSRVFSPTLMPNFGKKTRVISEVKHIWVSNLGGIHLADQFQGGGANGFPMGACYPGPDADQFLPDSNQPNNVALRRCPSNRFVTCLWQQRSTPCVGDGMGLDFPSKQK